ncbi:MAG: electron transport complex subunit RsxC [Dissulfurispiraceae bacterium]
MLVAGATFRGGIHPKDKKELSRDKAITSQKPPKIVFIPMSQHIGAPCKLNVEIGQEVKKGDVIGVPEGFVSAPVHSSVSGRAMASGEFSLPNGRMVTSVVIENDGKEEWTPLKDSPDYMQLSPDDLKGKIRDAGVVGMGGAAFPTHVKLSPPKEKPIDVVIINGAECEPYLTADYRLMIERPNDIVQGLMVMMRILDVRKGYIGIENNKPDAIEILTQAVSKEPDIQVMVVEVKYPQGAEKMLIKACIDREVPPRALPMDVGVVVQNVSTTIAVYEAVRYGKPLIERVVTVTGEGILAPKNLMVKIGTPVSDLIEECGGLTSNSVKIISGGPMMGFALFSTAVPVTKGTSGILVLPEDSAPSEGFSSCIRCGRCINICPMGLMPSMLSVLSERGFYEATREYNLFDCFECGSCTYVCPSKRPIVQLVRLAKSQVKP